MALKQGVSDHSLNKWQGPGWPLTLKCPGLQSFVFLKQELVLRGNAKQCSAGKDHSQPISGVALETLK
jgi:hypothetical protein